MKLEITLPEQFEIASAKDAPQEFRTVKTAKWTEATVLDALEFAVSERMGNTWNSGKKDLEKMKFGHQSLENGEWNAKTRGVSATKFDEAIKKLNIASLAGKLTREQLIELAKVITPDGEIKL